MLKSLLGVVHIEFLPLEDMGDIEFAIAMIVAVFNNEIGTTEIGQTSDDAIAHLFPLFLNNNPLVALFCVQI